MRALPEAFDQSALQRSLAGEWGFETVVLEYAELGFGSYHWLATSAAGSRGFVTVDDLDRKPWLGYARDSAFVGLRHAFDTALALRSGGLTSVVAPIPTSGGESVVQLDARYTVALFPLVEGRAGHFAPYDSGDERAAVVTMLAELHRATNDVGSIVRRAELELPGRRHLESGLRKVSSEWLGGPLSEPARHALARHLDEVAALLAYGDRLAAELATRRAPWVVTHGEPHPGNVMRAGDDLLLVDWDTVALAPPERDLWLVVGDTGAEIESYAEATGHQVDDAAMTYFRVLWELADLAAFIEVLRSPHRETDDTIVAYAAVKECATIGERWGSVLSGL